ncbi:acyltransferase [Brassicibacter mesophilus]|uniref:acyltransferase n=1 Tax=Brassicibacter mesophilus TaxID=745119 RepID=UPI003D1B65C5
MNSKFKKIGKNVKIYDTSKLIYPENIEIGNNVIIDDFVLIIAKKRVVIGNNVHIASYVTITGNDEFIIEDFSGISSGVKIFTSSDDYMGAYLNNPTVLNEFKNVFTASINIKKYALVGANTVVLPGSIIEEGTSIGANSLVNSKTEPYHLYAGCPIKKLKARDKNTILKLAEEYRKKYW